MVCSSPSLHPEKEFNASYFLRVPCLDSETKKNDLNFHKVSQDNNKNFLLRIQHILLRFFHLLRCIYRVRCIHL